MQKYQLSIAAIAFDVRIMCNLGGLNMNEILLQLKNFPNLSVIFHVNGNLLTSFDSRTFREKKYSKKLKMLAC